MSDLYRVNITTGLYVLADSPEEADTIAHGIMSAVDFLPPGVDEFKYSLASRTANQNDYVKAKAANTPERLA